MLSVEMARFRAKTISTLRTFFDQQAYLEVDTPLLALELIPEPHIEVFATEYVHPHEDCRTLFLVPSPEIWMKRLLVAGYGNTYQISRCFRNAESRGNHHNPEFTMLEWYTVDADYTDSANLTDHLLEDLCRILGSDSAARTIDRCSPPAERITVSEAFERFAGISANFFQEPDSIRAAARVLGMEISGSASGAETDEDIFHRILLNCIEPALPRDKPVMLFDYPAFVPTLACRSPNSWTAERWELYIGGIEIANCFTEERDSVSLASYVDNAAREKTGALVPHPPDEELTAFAGAPPCSGVALGVDRLIMALSGADSIRGVIHFPLF